MSRTAKVKKDVPISEIRKVKKDLQKFVDLYEKLSFIEDLYEDETVKSAIEKRGKTTQTGYKWLKNWNEDGIDGLFRKEGSGKNSKLSDYQFNILRENVHLKGLYSISEINEEIKKEFGISYSERHLRRLIFELGIGDVVFFNRE